MQGGSKINIVNLDYDINKIKNNLDLFISIIFYFINRITIGLIKDDSNLSDVNLEKKRVLDESINIYNNSPGFVRNDIFIKNNDFFNKINKANINNKNFIYSNNDDLIDNYFKNESNEQIKSIFIW